MQEEDSSEEEERPTPVESVEAISGVLVFFGDRGHIEIVHVWEVQQLKW